MSQTKTAPKSVVVTTKDYAKFKFLTANRDGNRGHIEALKKAFEEMGNLTYVQPILVNEKYEIIDGQHRFIAAEELKEEIYYSIVPGLTIREARSMNILHRNWGVKDFAQSYATTDKNYQDYLDLIEDYGFNHSVTLSYIHGFEAKGMFREFREGNFVLGDKAGARVRLDSLTAVKELVPFAGNVDFARAYLAIMGVEGFDQAHMLRKLELHRNMVQRMGSIDDYRRMLESIYNHQISEANRLRLF